MAEKIKVIRPQQGFQEQFLSSSADIVIGGGAAGAGKTFAEILEASRFTKNPNFGAQFFRRTYAQIKNTGGLWDESKNIYPLMGARSNEANLQWTFPSGATVKFGHLQYEKDLYSHMGAQYCLIVFDELTHFTESMFWYMLSRNRSACGVEPYIRATCNPDPDSWVARMIEWWIDQESGFPIAERSGVVRYFIRDKGSMVWGDTKDEVIERCPHIIAQFEGQGVNPYDLIKSLTFIGGTVHDNKELLTLDPGYLANLLSQDEVTQARLLSGNWKVKSDGKCLFDYKAINDMFENYVQQTTRRRYITCDAARYGRDFCVVFVWEGWEVIAIYVLKKSDVHDIIELIEGARKKFRVMKSNVVVDRDGVGSSTVLQGGYVGFSGKDAPKKVAHFKEHYKNLKTQLYYYLAEEKVNIGDIKINCNNGNCTVDKVEGSKIKVGASLVDIKDLIKADLKAIRRADIDNDGKIQTNPKEEQKDLLGRSPDFADTMMMRAFFDFLPDSEYL
jgi:hypothetical protein